MKHLFYIRNTKTDQNFDTIEMKFYGSNWEPTYEEDKEWLQGMIDSRLSNLRKRVQSK